MILAWKRREKTYLDHHAALNTAGGYNGYCACVENNKNNNYYYYRERKRGRKKQNKQINSERESERERAFVWERMTGLEHQTTEDTAGY